MAWCVRPALGGFALVLSIGGLWVAVGLSSFAAAPVLAAAGGMAWGIGVRETLNPADL